jgi:WD40 repeat protein
MGDFVRERPCASLKFANVVAMATLCLPLVGCAPPVANKAAVFLNTSHIWSLAFTPDGRLLAVNSPNAADVQVWEWQGTRKIIHALQLGGGGELNGLRFSSHGDFLASSHGSTQEDADRVATIWSLPAGTVSGRIVEANSGAFPLVNAAFEFTPDESTLLKVQKHSLIAYDTKTWTRKWVLNFAPVDGEALGVSGDGGYAAVAGRERIVRNGTPYLQPRILLINLAEQQVRLSTEILSYDCTVQFVAWSPDGHRIAIGGTTMDPTRRDPPALEIFDPDTGKGLHGFAGPSYMVALDYSSDGKYLLVGWGTVGVDVWDSAHTKLLQRIPGRPTAARFSPDGRHLAIAESRELTVWDMK